MQLKGTKTEANLLADLRRSQAKQIQFLCFRQRRKAITDCGLLRNGQQ